MTCRFELEFTGKAYPRSCPSCGLGGKCKKGYRQISKEGQPFYHLVDERGNTADGLHVGDISAEPPKLTQGEVGAHGPKTEPAPHMVGVGPDYPPAQPQRFEAPSFPIEKYVRTIDTQRRLALMGWLVKKLDHKYTVTELNELVDEIAAIILD